MALGPGQLSEVRAAHERLLHIEHEAERAKADYHHAIRLLHASGASMREIADAVGLSHQRIHQIVGEDAAIVARGRGGLRGRLGRRGDARCADEPEERERVGRFERFDAEAREVMRRGEEVARGRGHSYLGTEHVLLGLIDAEGSLAARVLASFVDRARVAAAVDECLGPVPGAQPSVGPLRLMPRVKKALDLAVKEAKKQRRTHAGAEHLLLAIVAVGGLACEILANLGVEENTIRQRFGRAACRCSFCERLGLDAAHLVAGPAVFICDRCVEQAVALAGGDSHADSKDATLTLAQPASAMSCSFCGKRADQAGYVVAGATTAICSDCLTLCREIRAEEQPDVG